ncbi:MAG: MFS transporter, partial [Clostridia bacterium]|nr:MFS transporter [Clostridia bacterium]
MKIKLKHLPWLMMITYMVSYLTRINYGAVLVEMVETTDFSKTQLSMAVTGSFITYGVGQVITGFLGDRFSPKRLVACGLGVTALINMILPFFGDPYIMAGLWCINGFAQAFMWPPIVRIMVALFNEEEYKHATVIVSYGSSAGTVLIYLCSPLIISLLGWHSVFRIASLCAIVMIAVWLKLCPEVSVSRTVKAQSAAPANSSLKIFLTPMMIGCMLAIILQGALRDGVTTWMPTYISETYSLGSAISILTGVALPVFSILCFRVTEYIYVKKLRSPLLCSAVVFGTGTLAAAVLMFVTGRSAAASIACTAALTGCMHGVNLILIGMLHIFSSIPAAFRWFPV